MQSPAVIGYATMVRKEATRIVRIWAQTLLPPVVTASLYFLIFGGFIGSQVAPIQGFTYMQFIVPGLVMMTIIMAAYMNTVTTVYVAKWQRTIDELLISPMPRWTIVAGFVTGGVIRAALAGTLVTGVALLFTRLPVAHAGILLAAAVLAAVLFALAGIINAIYANSFDGVSIVPNFVLTPLTYLGGVFYSVSLLPGIFRDISYANPILYIVNAFRYGFLGISDVSIITAFAVIGGAIAVLLVWVAVLFARGTGLQK